MSSAIELIDALAWPVVVAAVVVAFRKPLRDALGDATQLRIAGQEIQMRRERLDTLDALMRRMEQAEGLDALSPSVTLQQRILDRAQSDPLVALADLEAAVAGAVRNLVLANGWEADLAGGPADLWYQLLEIHRLSKAKPDALPALFLYAEIQDAVTRAQLRVSIADALRVIRFGLRIHGYLTSLPRRRSTVLACQLPVYKDKECLHRRADIDAVLIRTELPGEPILERVWPSNRAYSVGTEVSWTFDESASWPSSWWRNGLGQAIEIWEGDRYTFTGEPLISDPS